MEEIQGYKFGIDLDDGGMTRSLKELRNEAKLLKTAMKSNFTEIKSGGDAMKAYASKVVDAKRAISGQEAVIKKLREQQKGLDMDTEKGRSAYVRYENQIKRAKTEISNLSAQQERAKKSADLFKSGVLDVQRSVKLATSANKAYVERLQAEGRTSDAVSAKHKGLRDSYEGINKQLAIEKQRLNEAAEASGKSSDAYREQSIRVNELGTKLAHTKDELAEVQRQDNKLHPTGINRLISATDRATKKTEKANHLFGKVFAANLLSNGLINAWQSVTTAIGGAIKAGAEFDKEQQKMGATWQTLTGSIAKSKSMISTINKDSIKTGQDIDLVDELEQGYYHLHSNKKESDKMTLASLNMADAVGINKQQSLAVRQDMVNGLSKGYVQQGLLNQTSQYFPMFREALAKQLTHEIKTGQSQYGMPVTDPKTKKKTTELMKKVSVDDLPGMTKAGLIDSGEFEKTFEHLGLVKYKAAADNMMKTMYGMQRTIKARIPALLGDMEKPIINAKNPIYEGVSKWVSDPRTEKEFTKVGKAANSGINVITKAFAKAFGIKSAPQAMNKAMNGLAKGVTAASKSIARNAPEIKDLLVTLKSLGGIGFKTLIDSLKIANFLLKPFIKLIGGNADTFAKFAATWFVASKGLKAFNKGLQAVQGFKDIFGKATEIFGLKKEKAAIDEETAALNRNSRARQENADTSIGGGTGSGKVSKAENAIGNVAESAGGGAGKEAKELTRVEKYGSKTKGLSRLTSKLHGFGELGNVTKAGKVLAGSVGLFDVLNAGTDLIGTTKKTAGSHVGAAGGSLGGTAAGAAIGTLIAPGIGTAIGAGLGGLAGEGIGRKLGKAIQKGLSFQKIHAPKLSDGSAFDKLTKTAKSHYKGLVDQDTKNLKLLYKNGDITKSEYQKRLAIIQKTESKMTRLSSMSEKDRNAISKYYAQSRQSLTEKWNRKILADQKRYGKNSKEVAKDEAAKKKALQKQELKFATSVTAKEARLHTTLDGKIKISANKQESIIRKLTKEKGKLSKKQLLEAVTNSNKERKTVSSNANSQYKTAVRAAYKKYAETVKAAKDEYKGNSSYAKKQRAAIEKHAHAQRDHAIAAAEKQRHDTVKKADDQYNKTVDYAHKQNKGVTKQSADQYQNTKENNSKTKNNYYSTWHGIWKTVGNWVGKLISGLNKGAVKGQNQVFKQYGGTNTLAPITASYYATGTGVLSGLRRAITKPTLAVLNDGHDSPETGNRETVLHPNGDAELIHGSNTMKVLEPGVEVLNASETKLMGQLGLMHFASGTGFLSGLFKSVGKVGSFFKNAFGSLKEKLKAITGFTSHATKSFNSTFNPDFSGLKGGVAKGYAHIANHKIKNQGQKWWSAAWNVINGAANASGGDATGLLAAVEKYGKGHRYVWGAAGPDSFDCSGLVMYALKHAFGINYPHFSGSQYGETQHISKSSAKPGDLVFWGPNSHVGVYAGGSKYYSAFNPSAHPNIGMYNMYTHGGDGRMLFGRVKGLSGKADTKKNHKQAKGLSGFVTKQLKSSGVLSWVKKFLEPLTDSIGGANNPGGDGVGRWKSLVAKALRANGFSASPSQISSWLKVISRESGGNPKAKQPGSDPDHDGSGPALGLVQTKRGTFDAYKKSGHGNIWNGFDDLLAGINYAKHRYGSGASMFARVASRGYANGGLSQKDKLAHISEGNMPEMVIPLSKLKSSRGYELLGKTAAIMAKRDHLEVQSSNDNKNSDKLMDKLDQVIGLMQSLLVGQQNPVPAVVSDNAIYNGYNRMNTKTKLSKNLGRGYVNGIQ
ncbi:NlpC/P60 family protein [Levilactobacillus brevis]|uniref:NlpC/P60 family protein n=1 Tax=Levilactobacillus brevis TaxID=1580 RepID=UPI000760A070|nr:NlpC/P60 family protein [Levilactobacillus brevis]